MKKKIVIIASVIVSVLLVSNIITYAYSNETIFDFFFANSSNEQKEIVKDYLMKDGQKITIDNYVICLEESLCEKNTGLGYLFFVISDKEGQKVDADIDNYNNSLKSFGADKRFIFEYEATGTCNKYAEYKGKELYVYISFEITSEELSALDISKCLKLTDTKEIIDNEYKQYNFNLAFTDNCRTFKNSNGVLYISPLGLRFVTEKTMDDLIITLKDKNNQVISEYNNSENMLSESNRRDGDITEVQYTIQFENLLDIKDLGYIYINDVELDEAK